VCLTSHGIEIDSHDATNSFHSSPGNQVGEALALDHDVFTQQLGSAVAVTGEDGLDHAVMFVVRSGQAVAHPQLQAAVGTQAAVQGARLLD
jgi:hypothetical protein